MAIGPQEAIQILNKILAEKESEIEQLQNDCRKIRQSIQILGGQPKWHARDTLMMFLTESQDSGPMTPQQIVSGLRQQGIPFRQGSIYTSLRRLAAQGKISRDKASNTYWAH